MGKGGGGSSQPQTTTAYQTNLPEYAKPYVENMLNAAQKQVYTDDMSGFRPYTPYSTDPSKYFAGPSGLQQSTYGEAAGLRTPGGYAPAQALTGLSALGQMGAGTQYQQMATDPRAIQSYMSPYMQNVVDTQKIAAVRDYEKAMPALAAQASRQGAFGGSRSAIERAEAQRTLFGKLADIQAQGTQNAFQQAQQAQQFGANLGLQGLAGAGQMAGQLGSLAGAQQQADLARMGFQNQLGQQQQQYQQGIINQAVQDYATQQQYPMLQLANISNLLRGLPMQSATTQTYQAAPNALSQLGGLGATALGVYGASGGFRAAQGGEVKSYAGGGVVGGVEAQLMQMEIPELRRVAQTSPSASIREKAAEVIAQKQMAAQTKQSMGIDTLPAGNLDDFGMAGGGIIAFERGGDVEEPEFGTPEYDEKYGAPGSLKRKFKSIKDYYASPTTSAGVARNVSNTINAIAPMTVGAGVTGGQFIPKTGGVVTNTADYMRKLIGLQGGINAVASGGSGALPVPGNVSAAADSGAPAGGPAAPAAPAGGGAGGSGSAGIAGGKYEKDIEAGLADIRKGLGEGRAQKDLDALRQEMRDSKDQNLWLSLIQGGAKAMQSTSPHALVGLGAGVEEGARAYGKGLEGERADKKLLLAQQSALEQAEYARKTGNLNALIQAQGRLDAIQAQKENLGMYKESQLEAQRMKTGSDAYMRAIAAGKTEDEALAAAKQSLSVYDQYRSSAATAPAKAIPKAGDVRNGYRFKGGNPNVMSNWEKVK